MRHWQRTIEQGNRCFVTGALIDAREHYLHALALAQVLLERWGDADEAVMAFVISHHNLADLHLQLEQPEETAEYLCACHERLLRVSADQKLPLALRQAAQHHSRRTYVELLSFIGEHGAYPRLRARHRYARALRTRQASVDLDIARERRGAPTPNSKP